MVPKLSVSMLYLTARQHINTVNPKMSAPFSTLKTALKISSRLTILTQQSLREQLPPIIEYGVNIYLCFWLVASKRTVYGSCCI